MYIRKGKQNPAFSSSFLCKTVKWMTVSSQHQHRKTECIHVYIGYILHTINVNVTFLE